MSQGSPLDAAWRNAHPLPPTAPADKYARGRVLAVGGSRRVPAAIGLTAEAALRIGAGKVRIGTVASVTLPLGLTIPEAGMVALPETANGEIAAAGAASLLDQLASCDAFVFGPAMAPGEELADLVRQALARPRRDLALLLDAAVMLACADGLEGLLGGHGGRIVMTPHHGEMAQLLGRERAAVADDPAGAAAAAADRFGAVIVLKDRVTLIAAAGHALLCHESPSVGLGTAGSGDVLAGIIGGLLARGVPAYAAAAWGVWLHGQAGRAAGARIGQSGYLARELLAELPRLASDAAPALKR